MQRKAYNTPFWIMLFIAIFVATWNIVLLISIRLFAVKYPQSPVVRFNFLIVGWPVLLCLETIVYRILRKKIKSGVNIRIHLLAIGLCFFFLPLFTVFVSSILPQYLGITSYSKYLWVINKFRSVIFWGAFIIGHAFFMTTIVNIFRKNDIPNTDNEQPPGILDGILDEY